MTHDFQVGGASVKFIMVNQVMFYRLLLVFTILLQGCSGNNIMAAASEDVIQVNKEDKYKLVASEGAPKLYPMEVIAGSFFDPAGGSIYVPNKSTLHHGWGRGRSNHLVGEDLKALPHRLSISFFSYTENKFYRGDFKLPYQKILNLFKEGYISPHDGNQITYYKIIVGVAPGGFVSVWLQSYDRITEVFTGYATEEEGRWESVNTNPDITREEYVRLGIEDVLKKEEILSIKQNGIPFGLWETYSQRYNWQLVLNGMAFEKNLIDRISYFNGEHDFLYYPMDGAILTATRAIPSDFYFVWAREGKDGLVVDLKFNEAEILAAFKKLGSHNEPLKLEFRMVKKANGKNDLTIWLQNEKETIELKKISAETYSKP